MIAFHGDPKVKAKYLGRVRAHAKADQLIQGVGWDRGKGCAIGCTLEAYDHSRYPIELGVPEVLAHLEDRIFEGLDKKESMKWAARFLLAIPTGADLDLVWPRCVVWLLRKELAKHDKAGVCERVATLYDLWIAGHKPAVSKWRAARSAAFAAAFAAADTAAGTAAAAAFAAAAADTAAAAADTAFAAATVAHAANADRSLARREFWNRAATQLLKLLRSAPKAATPLDVGGVGL